jgi:hypothetical protein
MLAPIFGLSLNQPWGSFLFVNGNNACGQDWFCIHTLLYGDRLKPNIERIRGIL